jgi:hypothetical protein
MRIVSTLLVSLTLSLGAAALSAEPACTPAQVQAASGVFSDLDTACIAADLAQSVIPSSVEPVSVATDIADVCGLVEAVIPDLTKVVSAFASTVSPAADAGTSSSKAEAVYRQPAWAAAKIAAKRASRVPAGH